MILLVPSLHPQPPVKSVEIGKQIDVLTYEFIKNQG